jgi:hypothetical protein
VSENPGDPGGPDPRRAALVGLVVVAILFCVSYYLVVVLRAKGKLEDCLASGRTNCAPIEAPARAG